MTPRLVVPDVAMTLLLSPAGMVPQREGLLLKMILISDGKDQSFGIVETRLLD